MITTLFYFLVKNRVYGTSNEDIQLDDQATYQGLIIANGKPILVLGFFFPIFYTNWSQQGILFVFK